MASALAAQLGIPRAAAFDLNAACSGWLYALEVGRSLILGGSARNVIVVTAELLSRITNPQDHETAFLFGDGAGAAILTAPRTGHRLHRMGLSGDAEQFAAIQRTGGGARKPWPEAKGDLQNFYLQMDGVAVFKHAVIGFAEQIEETLRRERLRPEDIAWVVPHQANARILNAVSKRVGIPYEKFVMTIAKYGNTSARERLHGARVGGRGGDLHGGRPDHLLQRRRRPHLRRRPPRLVIRPAQPAELVAEHAQGVDGRRLARRTSGPSVIGSNPVVPRAAHLRRREVPLRPDEPEHVDRGPVLRGAELGQADLSDFAPGCRLAISFRS
jgi:hypothetical protein